MEIRDKINQILRDWKLEAVSTNEAIDSILLLKAESRGEQLPCEHEYVAIYLGVGYVLQCQKCGETKQ